MELAKVTTKGQVTIPKVIRDLLDLKEGSKILYTCGGLERVSADGHDFQGGGPAAQGG